MEVVCERCLSAEVGQAEGLSAQFLLLWYLQSLGKARYRLVRAVSSGHCFWPLSRGYKACVSELLSCA